MPFDINSVSGGTFNDISGDINEVSGNLTQVFNSQSVHWGARAALDGPGGHLPLAAQSGASTDHQSTIGLIRHQRMAQHMQHTLYGCGQQTLGPGTEMAHTVGNGSPEDVATSSSVSGTIFPYEHIPGHHGNISAYSIPLSGVHYTEEGTYNNVAGNMTQLHVTSHGESGLDVLYRHIAMGAVYDSGEQLPEPACHHGTRVAVLQGLLGWSTDEQPESTLLWLRGPAGMGKSAIAQTFAASCNLGASFFFRRGHPERGSWNRLFTTIAYQLAHSIPELHVPIQRAVEMNKLVVNQQMKHQFQQLIVEPFQQAQILGKVPILVLDGLDECEDNRVQQGILRLLIDAIRAHQLPMRILVASRPEAHIREVLESQATVNIARNLELVPDQMAYDDIRTYLRDEFSRIRLEALARGEKLGQVWPSPDILEDFIKKSCGIFIYAATVIRFVDDQYQNPQEQLQCVLDLDPGSTAPLDDLYTQILSTFNQQKGRGEESVMLAARTNLPLRILHTVWRPTRHIGAELDPEEIDALLDLPPNSSRRILSRLHSLLRVPPVRNPFGLRRFLQFLHASFADYLGDPRRSKGWCIAVQWLHSDNLFCMIRLLSMLPLTDIGRAFHGEVAEYVPQALTNATLSNALFAALRNEVFQDFLFLRCEPNALWPKRDSQYPMDLVEVWESHEFLADFVKHLKPSRDTSSPTFNFDSLYREILSRHPRLMFTLNAVLLLGLPDLWYLLRLYDLTYSVFEPFISFRQRLERPFPKGDSPLDFVTDPDRALELCLNHEFVANSLVLQWIHRTRTFLLDGHSWPWPHVLRGVIEQCHHPSSEIVAELATLDLSQMCGRLMSDPDAHDNLHNIFKLDGFSLDYIVEWLQACPDPPLEVIAFWERQAADICQCIGDSESEMGDAIGDQDIIF
ncbi:hypothetical protein B0H16DRAFT_1513057 [Mycena metata]|uniref:Nephrocystin 3-like N-terminal domain-containing protein n=1 Tax=Mycena metata TaxID=1033252 RepID=A0AAD7JUZ6_9AGAR|nr:hypothetical protein B0H16DRAFT_1513057 [Mycena metata]